MADNVSNISEYYKSLYKGIIITSIVVLAIGFATNGETSIRCYQSGYFAFGLSILLILIPILNKLLSKDGPKKGVSAMMLQTGPFMIIIAVVGFLLYFSFKYQDIIVDNRVPQGYFIFSNIATLLLIIQLFVVYSCITSDDFDKEGMSSVNSSVVLLLAVLTAICTNIIRTILKYFTTDGFEPNVANILKI
jgi:hypothetical protein